MSNSSNNRPRWAWKVVGIGLLGIASFYGTRALYLQADDQYPVNNQYLLDYQPQNQSAPAPAGMPRPPAFSNSVSGAPSLPTQQPITVAPAVVNQNPLKTLTNTRLASRSRSISRQVQQLVNEIRHAERQAPEKAAELKNKLKEQLEQEFNQKHQQHQKQIADLEKQLEQAKQLYDKREKNRSEIIARRTSQLLGQADDLAWELPANSSPIPSSSFAPFHSAASSQPMTTWSHPPDNLPINRPPTAAPVGPSQSTFPNTFSPQQTPLAPSGSYPIPARQPGYRPTQPGPPQTVPGNRFPSGDFSPVEPQPAPQLRPSTPPVLPNAIPEAALPPQQVPSDNLQPSPLSQPAPPSPSEQLPDVQAPVAPNIDEAVLTLTLLPNEMIQVLFLKQGRVPDDQVTPTIVSQAELQDVLARLTSVEVLQIRAPEEMEFSEVQKLMRVGLRLRPDRILFQSLDDQQQMPPVDDLQPEVAPEQQDFTQLPAANDERQPVPPLESTEPQRNPLKQDSNFRPNQDGMDPPLAEPEPAGEATDNIKDPDEA